MKRTEKEGFVEDFRERLQESPAIFLTDFSGLDVKSMTVLRDELRKNGAEYLVVKNRLVLRALQDMELPDLSDWLTGPTGVVIGHAGPVEAAKTVADFAKTHDDRPEFKVAVLDNAVLDADPDPATRQAATQGSAPGHAGRRSWRRRWRPWPAPWKGSCRRWSAC